MAIDKEKREYSHAVEVVYKYMLRIGFDLYRFYDAAGNSYELQLKVTGKTKGFSKMLEKLRGESYSKAIHSILSEIVNGANGE